MSACSERQTQVINKPGGVPIGAVPVGPTLVWPGGGTPAGEDFGPVPYGGSELPPSC